MKSIGIFPFGQPVQNIVQTDRSSKNVFILGVYASAVHARWTNPNGNTLVNALAVASEPYIFWRGENANSIIEKIDIPPGVGKLVPANPALNGPSGNVLDSLILNPLGLKRDDVWLCDLVPHSCINPAQKKAIEREYSPLSSKYGLPYPSVPPLPNPITDEKRQREIEDELIESNATILILLGDLPIRWLLYIHDKRWKKLADFETYGQLHKTRIRERSIRILPLAHPRQIGRLGQSSLGWYKAHKEWIQSSSKYISHVIEDNSN